MTPRQRPKLRNFSLALATSLRSWPQNDAGWDFASRDHAPERDQQFPGQRYYQFCFSACTRSLGTFLKPKHQCALFLEPQKSPSELDQSSPNAGISGLCQSFLAAFLAAFVGRTGQSSVSAHGPSVAEVPGKHFSYQHVGCLDSDTHDACKKTYHRVWPSLRCFLQVLEARPLNFVDLLPNEIKTHHVATNFIQ